VTSVSQTFKVFGLYCTEIYYYDYAAYWLHMYL